MNAEGRRFQLENLLNKIDSGSSAKAKKIEIILYYAKVNQVLPRKREGGGEREQKRQRINRIYADIFMWQRKTTNRMFQIKLLFNKNKCHRRCFALQIQNLQ